MRALCQNRSIAVLNKIRSIAIVATAMFAWFNGAGCRQAASNSTTVPGGEHQTIAPVRSNERCIVHLHGKGGAGRPSSTTADGVVHVFPGGNAAAWGGLEWRYFPDDRYREVVRTVTDAIARSGCGRAIVHGFSNGASAAAKMYCRGETFGGTLVGVIVDDPVPDHSVSTCSPAANVKLRLYSTGALAKAVDGWPCAEDDWTCEGETSIGIDRFGALLGTAVTRSVQTRHEEYPSPPEYSTWW
jgi:hypothetical protein